MLLLRRSLLTSKMSWRVKFMKSFGQKAKGFRGEKDGIRAEKIIWYVCTQSFWKSCKCILCFGKFKVLT